MQEDRDNAPVMGRADIEIGRSSQPMLPLPRWEQERIELGREALICMLIAEPLEGRALGWGEWCVHDQKNSTAHIQNQAKISLRTTQPRWEPMCPFLTLLRRE